MADEIRWDEPPGRHRATGISAEVRRLLTAGLEKRGSWILFREASKRGSSGFVSTVGRVGGQLGVRAEMTQRKNGDGTYGLWVRVAPNGEDAS